MSCVEFLFPSSRSFDLFSRGNSLTRLGIQRIKNCLDPAWCEPIYFEYENTGNHAYVNVSIWDDNRGKAKDKFMAKALVDLKAAIEQEQYLDCELDNGGT